MSGSDFFWGSVTGSAIQKGMDDMESAREIAQSTAEIRENIAREKQFQKTFQAASAKMDELRELLREAHGARDVNYANKENFRLGYRLLKEELRKVHPDAENIINDIDKQRGDLYRKILTDKGYKLTD